MTELKGIVTRLEFNKKIIIKTEESSFKSKGAFPHEEVIFTKAKKNRVKNLVVINSPYKKNLNCKHQEICGGCSFRELDYSDELKIKEEELNRLFSEFKDVFEGLVPSDYNLKYRNKMEYTFGNITKDGCLTLGLHEKGKFHNIISTDGCLIIPDDMDVIRKSTQDYFRELGISHYHRMNHVGELRHLVIRHSVYENSYMINLVTTSNISFDINLFVDMLLNLKLDGIIKSIYHTKNDSMSDAIVAEDYEKIYGDDYIYEKVADIIFPINPFSFFQTNSLACDLMYRDLRKMVDENNHVLDLYAGSATIGAILSKSANKVTSVEINPHNVSDAKEVFRLNDINNVEVLCLDCKDYLKEKDVKEDVVIIDPPRSGLHNKVVQLLNESGVKKIIYVSCNPVTLVENLKNFTNYSIEFIKSYDNFSGTMNVESIALLNIKE